jgi:hypothetical protein
MKNILLVLLMLLSFMKITLSQTFNSVKVDESGNIVFDETVTIDSTTKSQIYSKAREWFAVNFQSADAVLQMDDKDAGKLIGKAWQDINSPAAAGDVKFKIYYTISIFVRDNKYKYSISSILYKTYPSQTFPNPQATMAEDVITDEKLQTQTKWRTSFKNETLRVVNELSASIKKSMSSKNETDGEW